MKIPITAALMLYLACVQSGAAPAADASLDIHADKDTFHAASNYYLVEFSRTQPQLLRLAADSLGHGLLRGGALRKPGEPPRRTVARLAGTTVE